MVCPLAHGRFLSHFGGFMPPRQLNRHDTASHAFRTIEDGQGDTRHASLPVDIITEEASPREFFAALTVHDYPHAVSVAEGLRPELLPAIRRAVYWAHYGRALAQWR